MRTPIWGCREEKERSEEWENEKEKKNTLTVSVPWAADYEVGHCQNDTVYSLK